MWLKLYLFPRHIAFSYNFDYIPPLIFQDARFKSVKHTCLVRLVTE